MRNCWCKAGPSPNIPIHGCQFQLITSKESLFYNFKSFDLKLTGTQTHNLKINEWVPSTHGILYNVAPARSWKALSCMHTYLVYNPAYCIDYIISLDADKHRKNFLLLLTTVPMIWVFARYLNVLFRGASRYAELHGFSCLIQKLFFSLNHTGHPYATFTAMLGGFSWIETLLNKF